MGDHVLVIGGAGYIGSHMVRCLKEAGHKPVVLDNLSSGYSGAVGDAELIIGDIGNAALLDSVFNAYDFAGVMHFASFIQVGESVIDPAKYYDNNLARTITLLNAMVRHEVGPFIFSSTAAIFGNPQQDLINESHVKQPINPYGRTKLMVEQLLEDYHAAYGLRFGCLRYFNAAGAHPDGSIGERHEPETHLIPLILQAASGRRASIKVFGDDYDTEDGTCIRDYIHVCDLADAHLLTLKALQEGKPFGHYNLGTGNGYSIMQVIEAAKAACGFDVPYEIAPRRAGDPAVLVADGSAARRELGWQPSSSDLETIVKHAWHWEQVLSSEMIVPMFGAAS